MSGTWLIGGASVRGSAHARTGRPNQDAIAWLPPEARAVRVAGAVSDGHGAPVHFRSDVGARLAVDGATALLAWQMDDAEADEADPALAGELVDQWQKAVARHAAATPFSDVEALLPGSRGTTPYGATLVAFAANDTMLVVLQIGDGDMVIGYPDGRIDRPLASDVGLVGEETYSLCLPDAVARFRAATLWREPGRPWPDFIAAASDGVSKSFQDEAAFQQAMARLRAHAAANWPGLLETLPDWLEDLSNRGSGDDSTICIAVRSGASKGAEA